MPKKSYMDKSNILNEEALHAKQNLQEGFLQAIKKFFAKIPKIDKEDKKAALKKLWKSVNGLNSAIDDLEKANAKWLPKDYPKLPRFQPSDFIK